MSTYTIRLQNLINSNYDIWDNVRPFPIYNENHRAELQQMIVDHYLMQEIGFETPMLFKHYLNTRMREIMPKYNAMYESVAEEFNLDNFYTYKEKVNTTDNSNNTSKETHNDNRTDKRFVEERRYDYDTPMNFTSETVDSSHMSGASINKANGENNRNAMESNGGYTKSDTGNKTGTITKQGTNQSPYKTIEEYRALIFDIDRLIIEELSDLFMQIF